VVYNVFVDFIFYITMSKASKKEKKRLRRIAELQRLAAMQKQQGAASPLSSQSPNTPNALNTPNTPKTSSTPQYSSEVTAEFAHVKFDLIKIGISVLLIAAFITAIALIDKQTGFLSDLAKLIFRFLQLQI
jgi:hypothetical protein